MHLCQRISCLICSELGTLNRREYLPVGRPKFMTLEPYHTCFHPIWGQLGDTKIPLMRGVRVVLSRRRRRPGGQPGSKPLKTSEILVTAANGDRMKIYVREIREPVPGTQTERKQVIYELSSGERVQQVGIDTFILQSTGAKFVCIKE